MNTQTISDIDVDRFYRKFDSQQDDYCEEEPEECYGYCDGCGEGIHHIPLRLKYGEKTFTFCDKDCIDDVTMDFMWANLDEKDKRDFLTEIYSWV